MKMVETTLKLTEMTARWRPLLGIRASARLIGYTLARGAGDPFAREDTSLVGTHRS